MKFSTPRYSTPRTLNPETRARMAAAAQRRWRRERQQRLQEQLKAAIYDVTSSDWERRWSAWLQDPSSDADRLVAAAPATDVAAAARRA